MNIKTLTFYDYFTGGTYPKEPFFFDANICDIENTVLAAIKNLPDNCIGMSVRYDSGYKTRATCIRYAKETGFLIRFVLLYKGLYWS